MIVRAASLCTVCAFVISKIHNFRVYWHRHALVWHAARALLDSTVCTDASLRMSLGQFDNCAEAHAVVAISPVYRAVYAVAEEMHICGNFVKNASLSAVAMPEPTKNRGIFL